MKEYLLKVKKIINHYKKLDEDKKTPALIWSCIIALLFVICLICIDVPIIMNYYGNRIAVIVVFSITAIIAYLLYGVVKSLYYNFIRVLLDEEKNIPFIYYYIYSLIEWDDFIVFGIVIIMYFVINHIF